MVVQDFETAQVHLILASDDEAQVRELTRDLQASKYRYVFDHRSRKQDLRDAVAGSLARNGGRIPTVMVINYNFATKECPGLLRLARDAGKKAAIECVVTNPPAVPDIQNALTALGARLFHARAATLLAEMTFH
jgi:hypothetical protein